MVQSTLFTPFPALTEGAGRRLFFPSSPRQELVAEQEYKTAELTLRPDFKLPVLWSPLHPQEAIGPRLAHMQPHISSFKKYIPV